MNITNVSVKILRSFDYCHFEVNLSATVGAVSDAQVIAETDELRKTAARLADKAVKQYRQRKRALESFLGFFVCGCAAVVAMCKPSV